MSKLDESIKERNTCIARCEEINNIELNGGELTEDLLTEYSEKMNRKRELDKDIAKQERREEVSTAKKELDQPAPRRVFAEPINHNERQRAYDAGLHEWATANLSGRQVSSDIARKAASVGLDIMGQSVKIKLDTEPFNHNRQRALTTTGTNTGLSLMPSHIAAGIERKLLDVSEIRQYATVIRTSDEGAWTFNRSDNTANVAPIKTEAQDTVSVDPYIDTRTLANVEYTESVDASWRILKSAPQVAELNYANLADSIAYAQDVDFYTRANSGLLHFVDDTESVNSAAVTYQNLLNLKYSAPRRHRKNMTFVFSDDTEAYLAANLKDENDNLIWQENARDGSPNKLLGQNYITTPHMESVTSATSGEPIILFVDLSKFYIRDAGELEIKVSEEHLFKSRKTVFLGMMNTGSVWTSFEDQLLLSIYRY
jgi:HK97 family phage major capsid protein